MTTCEVCGHEDNCVVVCSCFGAFSFSVCGNCLVQGKEKYSNMVHYIANAGHFPEDINPEYQAEVRHQLKLHNKTEEEFIQDVEKAVIEEALFWEHINEKFTNEGGDNF